MSPKIIIALGNPGARYESTRHNVGQMFIEHYREQKGCPAFNENKKCHAWTMTRTSTVLAFPFTYMNESGQSAVKTLSYYKSNPEDHLIVIHDDLDLRLGDFKVSRDRGAAGHGGVASITQMCGTQNYTRIRIGIDNRTETERTQIPGRDYVLARFSATECDQLTDVFDALHPVVDDLIIPSSTN